MIASVLDRLVAFLDRITHAQPEPPSWTRRFWAVVTAGGLLFAVYAICLAFWLIFTDRLAMP